MMQILCRDCKNVIKILHKCSKKKLQINMQQRVYCKMSVNTIQILGKYWTNIIQILCKGCKNFIQILHKIYTNHKKNVKFFCRYISDIW